jgi:DNA-binding response OmpR family regulator
MEGDEALRRIRLIDNKVPVTIITGHADSAMMTRARAFGVHKVLSKPFNIPEVVAVINGVK